MTDALYGTRQVSTVLGKTVIKIPANAVLKTSEIIFHDIPEQSIRYSLNSFENAPSNSTQRVALANHFAHATSKAINIYNETSKDLGRTEGDTNLGYFNIDANDGSINGVGIHIPATDPKITIALDNFNNNYLSPSGFKDIYAAIASTINHEIGHYYIKEKYNVFGGHGDAFERIINNSDEIYVGLLPSDVTKSDVYRWEHGLAQIGNLYRVGDGEEAWLAERALATGKNTNLRGWIGKPGSADFVRRWLKSHTNAIQNVGMDACDGIPSTRFGTAA